MIRNILSFSMRYGYGVSFLLEGTKGSDPSIEDVLYMIGG